MTALHSLDDAAAWLETRARALRTEIAAARSADLAATPGHEVVDRKEEADERAAAVVHDAELERDLAELRDVDAARQRLAAGRYTECEDCGADIEPRRLLAQPTARRCMACQTRAERRPG